MTSPYTNLPVHQWKQKTLDLILSHPLKPIELYQIVLKAWEDIFNSKIGNKPFRIGQDLFPSPQIMGYFLHELIPLELAFLYPSEWRIGSRAEEKDLIYVPDNAFSIEIKTSSNKSNIYGNRSYTQTGTAGKKVKSGYYLAINFEKFSASTAKPDVKLVRFGWLDYEDWVGQASATGQQAYISFDARMNKLITLPLE